MRLYIVHLFWSLRKQSMYLDLKRFEQIGTEVFAENMTVDYTSMFGGEPYQISGTMQAQTWKQQIEPLDSWQHVTT